MVISAAGFFSLNFELLTSVCMRSLLLIIVKYASVHNTWLVFLQMVAATTSYMLVIIQFELNDEWSVLGNKTNFKLVEVR